MDTSIDPDLQVHFSCLLFIQTFGWGATFANEITDKQRDTKSQQFQDDI